MEKIDISRVPLAIHRISGVFKRSNRKQNLLEHNPGRFSDALCYILNGSCSLVFDDGDSFTVHPGQILYLAQNAVYDMKVLTPDYTFVYCNFYFFSDKPRKSAVFIPPKTAEAANLFNRLLRSWNGNPHDAFYRSMALLYEICGLFSTGGEAYGTSSQAWYVEDAERSIRQRFCDPTLSIGGLASQAGVSDVYFRKQFQARWGMSPYRYLLSVRLERAKELLADPSVSVAACALECGFHSTSYFCRIFRREIGTTPAQYRKNC